jgi:hypothetical protein
VAALGARGLFVVDEGTKSLKPVFSSGERIRDVLPAARPLRNHDESLAEGRRPVEGPIAAAVAGSMK